MGDDIIRIKWTNEQLKCFLETCLEEVTRSGRNGGSLKKESWPKIATKLEEEHRIRFNQKQLKNQFDYLKQKYSGWVYLTSKTGNIYDAHTNTFNMSNEQWEEYCKGHPKVKSLRTSPLLFPDLCTVLFDGTAPTGSRIYAPSSNRERSRVSSASSFTRALEDNDDDDVQTSHDLPNNDIPNDDGPNIQGPSRISSQVDVRPQKKSKCTSDEVNYQELPNEMTNAIRSLVGRQTNSKLEDCVAKLNTLGLEPSNRLYRAAYDIFGQSTLLRETWLMMPMDPLELRDWISRTTSRLGFM